MDATDDAVVAYLRANAPGPPTTYLDPRAVTVRAGTALRRRRRRRLRISVVAVAAATTAYLTLALAGPLLPGAVNVPGGSAIRAAVAGFVPGMPPTRDERTSDVDRLEADVVPVVERLQVTYYVLEPGQCRLLEYGRGHFADPGNCADLVQFDAQASADFDEMTTAVERSGVSVERIRGYAAGIYVQLRDSSWQYNYEYVYLPNVENPPAINWPGEEQWTHIRGHWWFHRTHDD
jgi:hypothetical protein